jgi:hypothetical protein
VNFLLGGDDARAEIRSSAASILVWAAMLGLAMLVGARNLYLLFTPPVPPSSPPRPSGAAQPKP